MKNILVVNVNWVGDVIFSTPIFRALKRKYPQAKIACMAVPRVEDILLSCPDVDEVIVYDEKGEHWDPLGKLKIIMRLRREKFDIAFLLHRSWTRALLVYLGGVKVRVGYDEKQRGGLLTHRLKSVADGSIHRSDFYLRVIESFGVDVLDRNCELTVSQESRDEMDNILNEKGIHIGESVVVVHPGGNWNLKRWSKENFALLIEWLINELKMKVIISGGEQDTGLASECAALSQTNPVIMAGETNLRQLLALMKRADLVISSDSGPLHIASSVGTSVIGIFGPTRPEVTGPRGPGKVTLLQKDVGCNRAACYYLDCPDNVCMQAVTVDEVMDDIRRMIESDTSSSH